eukprot:CAMPEP_0172455792 /NCGR_PEP_ID=MMETSP1065-20121228/12252_1 /TAXON_ID=265537 /ORGANISM="Amphiprora paludosa, Strain CCMP125" /LENGTH=435 /DNA_ID=CAMNT_0013208271 /DNA_START=176 /DNA_END=1483 /DNA_ORIENTATION=-
MPKAEKGSVKDIAKGMKAKGLQKLKFYCQMCEKQCRDANGFKCHIASESHLRQMKLFSENASGIMDQYSREFEKVFLDTLRMLHGTANVNANQVYQQVIRDKQHVHMNSTIWASLSDFCQYLGKTGKCRVEENERGWYVTYINRDVSLIVRQQEAEKRMQAEQHAEVELAKRLEERRKEAALALDRAGFQKLETTNLAPRQEDETIRISLSSTAARPSTHSSKSNKKGNKKTTNVFGDAESDNDEDPNENQANGGANPPPPPPLPPPVLPTTLDRKRPRGDASQQQQSSPPKQQKTTETNPSTNSKSSNVWLYRDIVVRIVSQDFKKGRYFRRKAYVDRVQVDDKTHHITAEVTLLPEKDRNDEQKDVILFLSQSDLETVVPKQADSRVRILKGEYRGKKATVLSLNKKEYRAKLEFSNGTILHNVNFEDFAQLA